MNTVNDNTDDFVKKAVKAASLEKPSDEFITSVMNKIEGLSVENSKLPVASSIISWKGWVIIGLIIASIFTILFLTDSATLSFSFLNPYFDNITSLYYSISVYNTFMIGLFAFIFFFVIDIFLVTRKINKSEIAV